MTRAIRNEPRPPFRSGGLASISLGSVSPRSSVAISSNSGGPLGSASRYIDCSHRLFGFVRPKAVI